MLFTAHPTGRSTVSLDPSGVPSFHVVSRIVSYCGDEPARLAELAGQFELGLVALTRGEKGSVLYSGGRWSIHPGYETRVASYVCSRPGATPELPGDLQVGFSGGS